MAPMNSSQSGPPSRGTSLLPVGPTPELQELYDELRRAEDEERLRVRLPLQVSEQVNSPKALLQPGALPQGTIMSRSTSDASLASKSTTSTKSTKHGGTNVDDLGNDLRRDARPRKRAIRRRPLDKVEKARAALVRKLHACPQCRSRKVTVSAQQHNILDFHILRAYTANSALTTTYRCSSKHATPGNPGRRGFPLQNKPKSGLLGSGAVPRGQRTHRGILICTASRRIQQTIHSMDCSQHTMRQTKISSPSCNLSRKAPHQWPVAHDPLLPLRFCRTPFTSRHCRQISCPCPAWVHSRYP